MILTIIFDNGEVGKAYINELAKEYGDPRINDDEAVWDNCSLAFMTQLVKDLYKDKAKSDLILEVTLMNLQVM